MDVQSDGNRLSFQFHYCMASILPLKLLRYQLCLFVRKCGIWNTPCFITFYLKIKSFLQGWFHTFAAHSLRLSLHARVSYCCLKPRGYYGTELFSVLYFSKNIPYRNFVSSKNIVRNSTVRIFSRTVILYLSVPHFFNQFTSRKILQETYALKRQSLDLLFFYYSCWTKLWWWVVSGERYWRDKVNGKKEKCSTSKQKCKACITGVRKVYGLVRKI